ncbi:MAG: DUF418 domain-containing protein [Bacteroidetes bacterium]|nr:DUF418 domain-containing protein [Bacteroidota bacterium]
MPQSLKLFMSGLQSAFPRFGNQAADIVALNNGKKERIAIIDTLRGFAVLGILLVNINWFGMPFQYNMNLNLHNEYSGPNYIGWWLVNSLFEGSQRAIFSMLFGASTILLISKMEKKPGTLSPADFYYRRLMWLLIFGFVNAFMLLWPGDILYSYALCGFFLFPFRNLKAKHLFVCGIALMILSGVKSTRHLYLLKDMRTKGEYALQQEKNGIVLTDEQAVDKKNWQDYTDMNNTETLRKQANKQYKVLHKGYFDILKYYKVINEALETVNFYNNDFWDILAFFFIGMAFFKWNILSGGQSARFYWITMSVGYIVGLTLAYKLIHADILTKFDDSKLADIIRVDFYQEKRLFMAMGHLSVVMLLYKYHVADGLLKVFSNVGRMTLTNYLMQSIICSMIFYGYGFKMFGMLQRHQLYYVVVCIWVFQIIFSNIWLQYFKFGPFEWLWRSLTYWKKQPLRREKETIISPSFAGKFI